MATRRDPKRRNRDVEPPLILLVEDEDTVRSIAERTLAEAGYRVIPAANPPEAAAKFRLACRRVDLLVADIVLPHRYGTILYKELRRLQPTLPVLFISGFPDIGRGSGRTRLPGTPFLYKPFTSFDLRRAVARIIAGEEWVEDEPTGGEEITLQPDAQADRSDTKDVGHGKGGSAAKDDSDARDGLGGKGDNEVERSVTGRSVSAGLLGV